MTAAAARRVADWKHGPHQLTYRQPERTFGLVADALGKDGPMACHHRRSRRSAMTCSRPRSRPSPRTPAGHWPWTGRTWILLPPAARGTSGCADPEASWGHRKNNLLRRQDELFYGYYLSAGAMVREENGPAVPELARRARSRRAAMTRSARSRPC